MNRSLDSAVLITLAYSASFRYPLSLAQVWLRLLQHKDVSLHDFFESLARLESYGLLSQIAPLVRLRNTNTLSFQERYTRIEESSKKIASLKNLVVVAQLCPWIKAVGITGSVAVLNATPTDDVDLFIITQKNRLWITRLFMEAATRLFGTLRPREIEIPNSWCMNLWLEESHLALLSQERSLYTAHEIVQVLWIYSNNSLAEKFLQENRWSASVLPRAWSMAKHRVSERDSRDSFKSVIEYIWNIPWNLVGLLCNAPAYLFQMLYMRSHKSTEVVEYSRAFFHPKPVPKIVTTSLFNIIQTVVTSKKAKI